MQQDEAEQLGLRLLNKALSVFDVSFDEIPPARISRLLSRYGFDTPNQLLADIGLGGRMAQLVARALVPEEEGRHETLAGEPHAPPLVIRGTEGMLVNYAKCCHPIPGDPIMGFLSAGRGIVIHTSNCSNVADFRKHPEKWIDVQWEEEIEGDFQVGLRVDVSNQRGVLARIAAAVADMGANIENVAMEEGECKYLTMAFTLSVRNRHHLAQIMRYLHNNKHVRKLVRS